MTEKLDINQADKEALEQVDELKGHAHEIVRYRAERGGFTSVDQLDEVPGLTRKVSDETRARLSVGSG
jgi:competence protein ComEA